MRTDGMKPLEGALTKSNVEFYSAETIKLLQGMAHPVDCRATAMRSHTYAEEQGDLLGSSNS